MLRNEACFYSTECLQIHLHRTNDAHSLIEWCFEIQFQWSQTCFFVDFIIHQWIITTRCGWWPWSAYRRGCASCDHLGATTADSIIDGVRTLDTATVKERHKQQVRYDILACWSCKRTRVSINGHSVVTRRPALNAIPDTSTEWIVIGSRPHDYNWRCSLYVAPQQYRYVRRLDTAQVTSVSNHCGRRRCLAWLRAIPTITLHERNVIRQGYT